ncbi:carbohydrate kinase family protein, partial [Paenibacillus sp.]|uniref:carbohydrate kinase family protein n=1 Tax=Paenibacillus sp. TaxID=58172 RepID=UPI002D6913DE
MTIAVIGNIFLDVKGYAAFAYDPQGKNVGDVRFVHGGVGRNVAVNLASLGAPTRLVATVDDSALGGEAVDRLRALGVDVDFVRPAERGMGLWLAILDENGDLAGSISRQPNFDGLLGLLDDAGADALRGATHVALSIDLTESVSAIALARCRGLPIYGLPHNLQVAARHPELLAELDAFVCNHIEFDRLRGADEGPASGDGWSGLANDARLHAVRSFADSRGLRALVVTQGAAGSVFYDRASGLAGHQPAFPTRLVDSSGAGDAFS